MQFPRPVSSSLVALSFAVISFLSVANVEAGARRFTYVYEATTAPTGSYELETWITWGTSPREERRFNAVDFRHEIEFGVPNICKPPSMSRIGDIGKIRGGENMDSAIKTRRSKWFTI